jgi:hypothetical protein
MAKDWDFYACRVDDKPASIFVDLALACAAPIAHSPALAYVFLEMNAPRPDGLSSQTEFATLAAIEDALEKELCAERRTVYVGRSTSAGRRDFFFYCGDAGDWKERVDAVMRRFPDYDFDCGARGDREWRTYFEFLYPSPEDHQRMRNRRVCFNLEKHGDALAEEREIDHWADFPSAAARAAFIERAEALGFRLRGSRDPEKPGDRFGVRLYRRDVPSFDGIDNVTLPLFQLAEELGGDYDGWETLVIRE